MTAAVLPLAYDEESPSSAGFIGLHKSAGEYDSSGLGLSKETLYRCAMGWWLGAKEEPQSRENHDFP